MDAENQGGRSAAPWAGRGLPVLPSQNYLPEWKTQLQGME